MNIVYLLAPLALALGALFAGLYIVAANRGQFDDLDTPPQKMLLDDESQANGPTATKGRPS